MNIEGLPPIFFILAEIDFNATGVLGVPLGTILLLYILMNMNNNSPRKSSGPSESEIAATNQQKKENWSKFIAGTSRLERWTWFIMVVIIPIALAVKMSFNMFDTTGSSTSLGSSTLLLEAIIMGFLFFGGGFLWIHRINCVVVNDDERQAPVQNYGRRQSSSPSTTTTKPSEVQDRTGTRTNVSQVPRRSDYNPDFAFRKTSAESEKPFTMEEFLGDLPSENDSDEIVSDHRQFNISEAEELLTRAKSFIRLKRYSLALDVILIYLSLPIISESGKRQGLRIREYARAKCSNSDQDKIR